MHFSGVAAQAFIAGLQEGIRDKADAIDITVYGASLMLEALSELLGDGGGGGGSNPHQKVLDQVNGLIKQGFVINNLTYGLRKSDFGVSITFSDPKGANDPNGRGAGISFVNLARIDENTGGLTENLNNIGVFLDAVSLTYDMLQNGVTGAQQLANRFGKSSSELIDIGNYKGLKIGRYGIKVGDVGTGLGVISLVITGLQMSQEGFNWENGTDAVVGLVSLTPGGGWIIGGIYFIGNPILEKLTGKSLGEWNHEAYKTGQSWWQITVNGLNQLNNPLNWGRWN